MGGGERGREGLLSVGESLRRQEGRGGGGDRGNGEDGGDRGGRARREGIGCRYRYTMKYLIAYHA
jgi:hypothetical protein